VCGVLCGDTVITFGDDLTPAEICEVFEAVISAWPAEHHRLVMALGNRLCGMADAMEREAVLGFSEYGNYGENNPPLP
jgi:hypothetical protein